MWLSMYATDHGDRVRVRWPVYSDPDAYLVPLHELVAASENYDAHQGDLGTRDLRPFADRLEAAEADVEEAFTEDYTIASAERVHAALGAAIVRAKCSRGDFSRLDKQDDNS